METDSSEIKKLIDTMKKLQESNEKAMREAFNAGAYSMMLDGFDYLKQEYTYDQWKKNKSLGG